MAKSTKSHNGAIQRGGADPPQRRKPKCGTGGMLSILIYKHNAPRHRLIEKNSHCSADRLRLFLLYHTLK